MMSTPHPQRSRDNLQRFLFEHAPIRGEIVHLDATWHAVLARHTYPPALRRLLGEAMAAAALLTATVKLDGRLVMQIRGRGPAKLLVAECTSHRTLRAMASWEGTVPDAPLPAIVGDGQLVITLDPTEGRERYQGIVELAGESLAAALEDYFARSEQLKTRLWLAADGTRAAGLLLQQLPDREAADADVWVRVLERSQALTPEGLLARPAREIIQDLYRYEDVRVFEGLPLAFRCSCSRDRVANTLRMLGGDEVGALLREQGLIDVRCEFCNQHYRFDPVDAEQLFATEVSAAAPRRLH